MLTERNSLAKTSSKPGKTQLINHFMVNKQWYLVDLPGYGWAKVSKSLKEKWGKMLKEYLLQRENLYNVFVLVDSRIPPQQIDMEFISWLGSNGIALSIIFTKADKPRHRKITANINMFKTELMKEWEELPATFITSAEKRLGREEILNFIDGVNKSE